MDELNINNLPPEMLTEVFRYLNVENSKNASLVCKLWKNLIESAFRWSFKLKYEWHATLLSMRKNFALTTNRKFGTIDITGRLSEDDQIVEIIKRHGLNVVELHLFYCHNLTGFADLLNFTPNLKHIVVDTGIRNSPGSSDMLLVDQLLPDLEKLKSLEIRGRDFRIIKCFRKAKLTAITIRVYMRLEHCSLLAEFLSTQDKLTSLTVDSYSSSILAEMGKLNVPIPFQLMQLSISDETCQKSSPDYDHFMRFIKSQAGNLTEIEMYTKISSSVLECVFANMTKLTTLWVETNHLPRESDFYDRLKENCNVHTVRLLDNDETLDIQFVGKFLQKVPNVRCLILMKAEGFVNKSILVMAQSLSKLESLFIDVIYGSSLDCVEFPNLKTLHIQYLQGRCNWNKFTKAHPLLTELIIERMDKASYLTTNDIDQITTNVDLQYIRHSAGFMADNRFFEIIESKCANLKVLRPEHACISQNIGHYLEMFRLRDSITRPKVLRSRLIECFMKI